ncbi:MAG TPA: hypothetical protein ENK88_02980 [Campylobacterales bacterium]|nr:hypothetical protein [Campylobacterales bacterium]
MLNKDDNVLHYKEDKLSYVIKTLKLVKKDMAKKMGLNATMISQIQNYHANKLRNHHIYAICSVYKIPIEIFEDRTITTKKQVDKLLDKKRRSETIFLHNQEVLEELLGDWYFYSYPSNPNLAELWETKTTFYDDYTVADEHDNKGILNIGQNQSIILKESNGSKNITSITFDNSRIFYNAFLFSRVSKSNIVNNEMFNFGICSRVKRDKKLVKEVLGDLNQVQLQINHTILQRLSSFIHIDN